MIEGAVAKLSMDVQEDQTLAEGYKLKLNSYDLGVDIELADAIQRIRFEHPQVRAVVITSLKPRIFCAGANIYMLSTSSHAFKVNFCKFTNETRCAIDCALFIACRVASAKACPRAGLVCRRMNETLSMLFAPAREAASITAPTFLRSLIVTMTLLRAS